MKYLPLLAGLLSQFLLFCGMFNGSIPLAVFGAILVGALGLFVPSYIVRKCETVVPLQAAGYFCAPSGFLALLAIGDAVAVGNYKAFIMWASVTLVSFAIALVGCARNRARR